MTARNVIRLQERELTKWSEAISAAWNKSFDAVIEAGRLLIAAKDDLDHGQFAKLIEDSLPFGARAAQMLMAVASDQKITNTKHASLLPPSWMTLYELTKLDEAQFSAAIAKGVIRPDMQRKDIAALKAIKNAAPGTVPSPETCNVTDLQRHAAGPRKYGTIYADPPWLYDNQGTRAATSNHYDGMTVDDLCALPVRDLAADDAHLHLWTTNAFLFECPRIFEAWGFEFRSTFVWIKPQLGIGNYWRNSHEILLTAVRGDAKSFADHNLKSWLECDRGAHSAKPEQVRTFIERASPGPRLELFARSPATGWAVWGNQIERGLLHHDVPEVA